MLANMKSVQGRHVRHFCKMGNKSRFIKYVLAISCSWSFVVICVITCIDFPFVFLATTFAIRINPMTSNNEHYGTYTNVHDMLRIVLCRCCVLGFLLVRMHVLQISRTWLLLIYQLKILTYGNHVCYRSTRCTNVHPKLCYICFPILRHAISSLVTTCTGDEPIKLSLAEPWHCYSKVFHFPGR
jgi:hypothetical protein